MHDANSAPYRSPVFVLANGERVTVEIMHRMTGVQVSAPLHWLNGVAPPLPEEWEGYEGEPSVGHFEHSRELLPRPLATVAAVQELAYAYNEVEGAVPWVSMEWGSLVVSG